VCSEMWFPRRALKRTPKNWECGRGGGQGFRVYIYIYIYMDTMGAVQTRGVLIIGRLLYSLYRMPQIEPPTLLTTG